MLALLLKELLKELQQILTETIVIENVKPGDVLVFSYMGFNTQEITVGNNSTINVAMVESAETLDEVVVIGYGTTTIKDATGSVAASYR